MGSHLFKLENCELLKDMKNKNTLVFESKSWCHINVAMWPNYIYWSLHDKVKTLVVNEWKNHCIWPLHVVFAWFWLHIKKFKRFLFCGYHDGYTLFPLRGSLNVVWKDLLSMEYFVSTKGSGNEVHFDKSHGTPLTLY